jgi:hypothetical protein
MLRRRKWLCLDEVKSVRPEIPFWSVVVRTYVG